MKLRRRIGDAWLVDLVVQWRIFIWLVGLTCYSLACFGFLRNFIVSCNRIFIFVYMNILSLSPNDLISGFPCILKFSFWWVCNGGSLSCDKYLYCIIVNFLTFFLTVCDSYKSAIVSLSGIELATKWGFLWCFGRCFCVVC